VSLLMINFPTRLHRTILLMSLIPQEDTLHRSLI